MPSGIPKAGFLSVDVTGAEIREAPDSDGEREIYLPKVRRAPLRPPDPPSTPSISAMLLLTSVGALIARSD